MTWAEFWNYMAELNAVTIAVRILLAALAGALVGVEREFHGRAAGLRTHMLVSLGAALAALIGCYLSISMAKHGINSDAQRTGAQVISGVGFLGAGTILLKKGNSRITGLTTAAGLWATASIGLAMGYGMYEAALITTAVVILSFTVIARVEFAMNTKRQRLFVYLELDSVDAVRRTSDLLTKQYGAVEIQVTPPRSGHSDHVGMEALIRVPAPTTVADKMASLCEMEHVIFALQIN